MTFAIVFGLGIVIGLRCSVLALLPTVFGIVCVQVMIDDPAMDRVASAIICTACVQGGYMVGLTARDFAKQLLSRFAASVRNV